METMNLGTALRGVADTFPFNHFCVYLVQDAEEILYIGKSTRNPVKRPREHVGQGGQPVSTLGRHILTSAPASDAWTVELYTVRDCAPVIRALWPVAVNWTPELAEECMIQYHRPLLNVAHNYDPSAHMAVMERAISGAFDE